MILCDINIFIHAFNGEQKTINELNLMGHSNIAISSITVMELFQGMGSKREMKKMKSRIKYFDILEVNPTISKLARKYIEKYKLSHSLQIPDAIIGATAIAHKIELFTYNIKDFSFIPGMKLYQPF